MSLDLLDREILLLDGGLGTTLEDEHSVKFSHKTPLWSSHLLVENTDILKTVQHDFAAAGADVILTATYQTSLDGFRNTKLNQEDGIGEQDATEYVVSAVSIARQAFQGRHGLVALSLGAYGATMVPSTEYSGDYGTMNEIDLFQFHRERLRIFQESSHWDEVDLIAFETLPRLDEVKAVKRTMQEVRDKKFWISCVFPNDDERLPDGTSIESLVKVTLDGTVSPFAIGINCTKIHKVSRLIQRFEEAATSHGYELPRLVIYPDGAGGKVYDTKLQQWIGSDQGQPPWDEQMIEIVDEVRGRGLWKGILVGGCCKTSPGHIAKLRKRIDQKY